MWLLAGDQLIVDLLLYCPGLCFVHISVRVCSFLSEGYVCSAFFIVCFFLFDLLSSNGRYHFCVQVFCNRFFFFLLDLPPRYN